MSSIFRDDLLFFLDEDRVLTPIPEGVTASLSVVASQKEYLLTKNRFIIGRFDADLCLDDRRASEKHAAIGFYDGFFFLIDLQSKNHTFVNGRQVVESVLVDGDIIEIGATRLLFAVKGEPAQSVIDAGQATPKVARILEVMFGDKDSSFDDATQILLSERPSKTEQPPVVELFLEPLDRNSGLEKGVKFLQNEILIGRKHGDLALEDPDVSKKHAIIEVFGADDVFLKDLESTNGSFINDQRIKRTKLKNGDTLLFGSSRFQVKLGKVFHQSKVSEKAKSLLRLRVVSGMMLGKMFEVGAGSWTIGNEKSDINLYDSRLRDPHVTFTVSSEQLKIEHAGDGDPLMINGRKTQCCVVDVGDVIRLARTEIKIEPMQEHETSIASVIEGAGYKVDRD